MLEKTRVSQDGNDRGSFVRVAMFQEPGILASNWKTLRVIDPAALNRGIN